MAGWLAWLAGSMDGWMDGWNDGLADGKMVRWAASTGAAISSEKRVELTGHDRELTKGPKRWSAQVDKKIWRRRVKKTWTPASESGGDGSLLQCLFVCLWHGRWERGDCGVFSCLEPRPFHCVPACERESRVLYGCSIGARSGHAKCQSIEAGREGGRERSVNGARICL